MNLPSVTIKQLLEAGVHLGHKTFRWNPKMKKYIFGSKDSILIIDNGSNDGTIEYLKNQPYDWTQNIVDNYDTIINFK